MPPSPPRSLQTLRLLEDRKQAALRRQDALTPKVSTPVSRTIERMHEQIQIDTAEGTTGTSSSRTRSSRRNTHNDIFSNEYESRAITPNTATDNVAGQTRSHSLLPPRGTDLNALRPTINH